ncbi:MAG TPA: transporter substrate-binding domain-containing protein [Candidatus Binatia bacterium]
MLPARATGRRAYALCALLGVLALAACARTTAEHAPRPTQSAVASPLRVGTSGDYPPFSVRASDGSLDGFDVAVARAYAADRGRPLELVPFAWPELERRLLAGDFDVAMGGITVRGDRLARAPMTAAVARASAVLVVPADAPEADARVARGDGAGLRVAVNRGAHLERVARATLPGATLVLLDDNRSLAPVLASGEVDAVVTDTLELQSFAAPGAPQPRVARVLTYDRKAYWVAPHATELADDLDQWLAAREADGTLASLRARYGVESADAPASALDPATARVVDLVARRLLLMPEVAAAKRVASLPIDVPSREQQVYARARDEAARVGLAAEPYVALVREEVEVAKVVQRATLATAAPASAATSSGTVAGDATPAAAAGDAGADDAVARAKRRLEQELRPAIDRLDRALRAALLAAAPIRADEAALVAALRADAPVPGFGDEEARRLARALKAIPAAAPPPAPSAAAAATTELLPSSGVAATATAPRIFS